MLRIQIACTFKYTHSLHPTFEFGFEALATPISIHSRLLL